MNKAVNRLRANGYRTTTAIIKRAHGEHVHEMEVNQRYPN